MFYRRESKKRSSSESKPPVSPEHNPISKFYAKFQDVANGGTSGVWQIFRALNSDSGKEESIFFFDKRKCLKINPKLGRPWRSNMVELLKWDVKILSMLDHPRILCLTHPLEECNDSLAFAAEPVYGCLSTVILSKQNNSKNCLPLHLVEIKCGLLQITEALSYLQNCVHAIHGNICPETVFIDPHGKWKLGGFSFTEYPLKKGSDVFPGYAWNPKLSVSMQPNLSHMAPELHYNKTVTTAADVFSLGALIYYIYAKGKSLMNEEIDSLAAYASELDKIQKKIDSLDVQMEPSLKDAVIRMCSRDIHKRPTCQLFTLIKYFDDTGASALRQLDDLNRVDFAHKAHFLCTVLKNSLPFIPESLWVSRVLPLVEQEMECGEELGGSAIRPILYMMEHCSSQNLPVFQAFIHRILAQTMLGEQQTSPVLAAAIMEQLNVIFEKIDDKELLQKLLDLCITSLQSKSSNLQISVLNSIPKIRKHLSHSFFTDQLLPTMEISVLSSKSHVPIVHSMSYACLEKLLPAMDSASLDKIVKLISSNTCRDPEVLLAICKLVQRLLDESGRMGVGSAMVAEKIVPILAPYATTPNLSQFQVKEILDTCRECLNFVEETEFYGKRNMSKGLGLPALRPLRHSIAGQVPQVLVTSPHSPCTEVSGSFMSAETSPSNSRRGSAVSFKLGDTRNTASLDINDSADDYTRRKSAADIPAWLMNSLKNKPKISSTTSLQTHSVPGSPSVRRHSDFNPGKPSTLSNLGHNLACTLWNKCS